MTESHDTYATTLDVPTSPEIALETASRTPILITAPEVAFSTAAAVPVRKPIPWWRMATRDVAGAVRRIFLSPAPRRRYLDDGVMAREMHRL
jgi:hypothetical protein